MFALYEADPDAISGYADTLVTKSTNVGNVDVNALKGKAKAAEQVTGDIENLLDEPFETVGNDSEEVSLASAFAAGVLYRWSSAITTYNDGVEKLNTEYEQKKADSFGVADPPSGPSGGKSPGALQEEYDEDVADAKAALIKDLKDRQTKLESTLDDAADEADADLKKGPTKENVLALFASGDLPEAAFPLLGALGIDPEKAKEILGEIKTLLAVSNGPGPSLAWSDLLDALEGADPRIASVILGTLDEDQIKKLGGRVASESNNSELYSFLLAGATEAQVEQLKVLWSDLHPEGGENWQDPNGLTFYQYLQRTDEHGGTFIGAKQGQQDDCWMLAKLNAIVSSDPDWPQEHVKENSNGTVSVKFYDGSPYWVTVTDELPDNAASPEGPNSSNWAAYYEKAMAVNDRAPGGIFGSGEGYNRLTAGFSDTADVHMTGTDSDKVKSNGLDVFADPYDAPVEAHKNGEGVVAGNWGNDIMPWSDEDDDLKQWHVYYVKDIQDDGDVVLGNPWGYDDVVMSPDDFNTYLEDVSVVKQ